MRAGEAALELVGQPADVVIHLDVEDADQLLALGIDLHPGGADLLAENRQCVVGERINVGDVRIADHDVDEAGGGAHVLRLADGHRHHGGMLIAAKLDGALLRIGLARHQQHRRRQRECQRDGQIAQPVAALRGPVRAPPGEAAGIFGFIIHAHSPPLIDPAPALSGRPEPGPSSSSPHDCLRRARCIPVSPPHA